MPAPEWSDPEHAHRYLRRWASATEPDPGEATLLEMLPEGTRRILDLGTGDGRLLALLLDAIPDASGVGLDASQLMLDAAQERFAGNPRVRLREHDLSEPLPDLGRFDAVVSRMAIHHLEHPRKRALYAEAFELLGPGGTFANLEHVASPSRRLHEQFFAAIDEPLEQEDPSDRLLDVETQLGWLREVGFAEVDCHWKWRELALLGGLRPA
jgi:SAM-dependent methyltransferase